LWAFFNFAVSYILIWRVGDFSARANANLIPLALGLLLIGLLSARNFGRFHGGNRRASNIAA
jgi:hypothetical protein